MGIVKSKIKSRTWGPNAVIVDTGSEYTYLELIDIRKHIKKVHYKSNNTCFHCGHISQAN